MSAEFERPNSAYSDKRTVVKRFLLIFLPLSALVAIIAGILYFQDVKSERNMFEFKEIRDIEHLAETIDHEFEMVVSDLMILREQAERYLNFADAGNLGSANLSKAFLSISRERRFYDQIRYIDDRGMEIIRINFNDGTPGIVSQNQLQNKSRRYYFRDCYQLFRGEVFVSPFDLNIEHGEIEQPLKPMIRFGTPVFDSHGIKQGIVLLNYLGARLIRGITRHDDGPEQVMLLNSDGFFLKGPTPEDEWGFMYNDRQHKTFGQTFPQAWQTISTSESGQFHSKAGMITFQTVSPLIAGWKSSSGSREAFSQSATQIEGKQFFWKIMSRVSSDTLSRLPLRRFHRLLLIYAVLLVIISTGSWLLAQASERKMQDQKALLRAYDEMEQQVASRTQELADNNEQLKKEMKKRQTAERLRTQAYDNMRTILESMPFGVVIVGADRRLEMVNRAALEMMGTASSDEVLDMICHANVCPAEMNLCPVLDLGKEIDSSESLLIGRDGNPIPVLKTVIPIDLGGKAVLLEAFVDISKLKRAEAALLDARDAAESANKAKSEFLSNMSHEFRTPLNHIIGFTELVVDNHFGELNESQREYLNDVLHSSRHLLSLVNDILDISKIEAGKMIMNPADVHLESLLTESLTMVKENAVIHGIKLSTQFKEIPKTIKADARMLKQIMYNLLANAVKFTPDGGAVIVAAQNLTSTHDILKNLGDQEPVASLIGEQEIPLDGNYVEISVSDTGIGLRQEDLTRIFNSFEQVNGSSIRKHDGTGLGLSLAKRLVEMHGGRIWANSAGEDQGSTFSFVLPV